VTKTSNELHKQLSELIEQQEKALDSVENREFTKADKAENEKRFAKIEQLQHEIQVAKAREAQEVKEAIERHDPRIQWGREQSGSPSNLARDMERGRFSDIVTPLRKGESYAKQIATNHRTESQYAIGIGELCRAMVLGPNSDRERFALSEGTDSAGGYTVPAFLSATILDQLRDESVFTKAGAGVIPLTSNKNTLVRIATDPTPTWRAENASVAASDAVFEGVLFQPKTLAVVVKASRELLEDSLNVNEAIGTALAGAMAAELDRVVGFGSGTGSEPTGIVNTSGILTVTAATNGSDLDDYTKFLDGLYQLEANNAHPNAVIINPREARVLNGFADTTGQPLRRPEALADVAFLTSTKVPVNVTQGTASNASTMLMGDFTRLMIGVRTEMRIEVLRERFSDNLQYGFLCYLRADVAPTHPKAFCKIPGIIPA
jgi:HK97 family phage major capsid protein